MQFKGKPTKFTMGGVYASPYDISVNGTDMALVCHNFSTETASTWNANRYLLNDLVDYSVLKLGNHISVTIPGLDGKPDETKSYNTKVLYNAAALLSIHILDNWPAWAANNDRETAGEYSFAVWQI